MERYAFHYITETPSEVINALKKREKKVISEFKEYEKMTAKSGIDFKKLFAEQGIAYSNDRFSVDNMETIVAYYHDSILSIYSSSFESGKEIWIGRRQIALHKKIAVSIWQWDESYEITFGKDGKICIPSGEKSGNALLDKLQSNGNLCNANISIEELLHPADKKQLSVLSDVLGFPLLLPDDWEQQWTQKQLSEHIILASDAK